MNDVVTEKGGAPVVAAFRLLLSNLVTPARLASLGALGAVAILLGIGLRVNPGDDPVKSTYDYIVNGYSLSLLVPVTALVFASAALGDLAEDGTLVYLWLKPVARWQVVAAAFAAAMTIGLPVAVVPVTLATSLTDTGRSMVAGAFLSTTLATLGYGALFL